MDCVLKSLLFLFCFSFAQVGAAHAIDSRVALMKPIALMNFDLSNENPNSNDHLTIFAHLESDYNSADPVRVLVNASFDNQSVEMLHPSMALWTLSFDGLDSGDHILHTNLYLEDVSETDALRAEIIALDQRIAELDSLIPAEEDPAQRAIMQAERNQKNTQRDNARAQLDQAKTYIGSEDFKFTVQ